MVIATNEAAGRGRRADFAWQGGGARIGTRSVIAERRPVAFLILFSSQ
ncbi:MAG: hypothetical protein OEL76_13945 [Siculibacillus sp.]|nr:hypothetical protein [Siculibacillus sp.]